MKWHGCPNALGIFVYFMAAALTGKNKTGFFKRGYYFFGCYLGESRHFKSLLPRWIN